MSLPVGAIVMWYKSLAEIPADWAVCDGTNDTPDLRSHFIRGISADADLGKVYGTSAHGHTNSNVVAGDDHVHDVTGSYAGTVTSGRNALTSGGTAVVANKTHTHSIDFDSEASGAHSHTTSDTEDETLRPPYVQVYFIMKVTP